MTYVVPLLVLGAAGLLAAGCKGERADDRGQGAPPPRAGSATVPPAPGGGPGPGPGPGGSRDPALLPEDGPHGMYPTPRRAGTEDLFFLEEPVRGPHVTRVRPPSSAGLTVTRHAHCELHGAGVACGAAAPDAGDVAEVRVARRAGRPVRVEWRLAGRVDRTALLAYDAGGALVELAQLDDVGDVTSVRTYDPPGRRYTARKLDGGNALDGCGAIEVAVDAAGLPVAETCLQWLGEPMRDENGVVLVRFQRDRDGLVVREERFGKDGAPLAGVRDGVHRIDRVRDGAGRVGSESYFDIAGAPTASALQRGCAVLGYTHVRGLEREVRCTTARGAARADADGVAVTATEYDDKGCPVVRRFLDEHGGPASRRDVSAHHDRVDRGCRVIARDCRGRAGEAVACSPGEPAGYRHTRDRRGFVVATTYVGTDGERRGDPAYGVAEVRYRHDPLGRQVGESCHDEDGEAVVCGGTGFHRTLDVFDDHGRISERTFFDAAGRPTTNLSTVRRRYIYDNYDHLAETHNLDAAGQLLESFGMAIRRNFYDDSHRLFGVVLLDRRGQPARYTACFTGVRCPDRPWHAVRLVRTSDGKVSENLYFDDKGQLISTLDCRREQCWGDD